MGGHKDAYTLRNGLINLVGFVKNYLHATTYEEKCVNSDISNVAISYLLKLTVTYDQL